MHVDALRISLPALLAVALRLSALFVATSAGVAVRPAEKRLL